MRDDARDHLRDDARDHLRDDARDDPAGPVLSSRAMSLYSDPGMRTRIHALFDEVWPGLPARLAIAARLGADWHAVSTPFVAIEGDAVVAHVGVIAIPMVIAGERVSVAGIHAVATHPAHRQRGHCRTLLARAMEHARTIGETAQLTTELPRVYRSTGFRSVPQTCFVSLAPACARGAPPMRQLSGDVAEDVAILWRLCQSRSPISHHLGVVEPGWLLVIDEVLASWGLKSLYYAADLDAIVALEIKGGAVQLYDVIAAELPPLGEIAARIPGDFDRLEIYFTPDRFAASIIDEREASPGDHLMVAGRYPIEGSKLALPLLAHC